MHNIQRLKDKALRLTQSPGVYIMKNTNGKVIYVGKAKSLKNRVVSYFRNLSLQNEKVKKMVSNVEDFDFIITDSEFEALILECSLVKQYNPKYNILLKDDKGYHYIKISNDKFPRITLSKRKDADEAQYIGPYISSFAVKKAVDEVNRVFMLPTCTKKLGENRVSSRPCLNYYIKRCIGVCCKNISEKEYNEIIDSAVNYLKKGSISSLENMKDEMNKAAKNLDFEKAIKFRDRINAIEKINQSQKIYLDDAKNIDVISFAVTKDNICFVILKFRNGHIVDKDSHIFNNISELDGLIGNFITGYYSESNDEIPDIILTDYNDLDLDLYSNYIYNKTGKKVKIIIPKKGNRKKLVEMANSNATEYLISRLKYKSREIKALQQLQEILKLKNPPAHIEAYDISNLGNTGIVGGMVVFENGLPAKNLYRKFKIKTISVRDDYGSMKEMLHRRILEYRKGNDESFKVIPDLILIDGGKGHIMSVKEVLEKENFDVPCFGIIKDSKHRTRAISGFGGEISITSFKSAFSLLTRIQDEVHRYTISYQKKIRKKTNFEIKLMGISGIGEKRALKILKHFKSKNELLNADIVEVAKIAGVGLEKAGEILNFIKNS